MGSQHAPRRGPLVVASRRELSPQSADPLVRQVARRVALLDQLTEVPIRHVCVERDPETCPPDSPTVDQQFATDDPAEVLGREAAGASAIWATDGALADHLLRSVPEGLPPLVLDVTELPSSCVAASRPPGGRNSDGLQTLVDELRGRERRVFDAADHIVCADSHLLSAVAQLTATTTTELAPTAAPVRTSSRSSQQRSGLVHYGRWTSEPGNPDEDGFNELVKHLGPGDWPLLTVLSQDAWPRLRQNLPSGIDIPVPADWLAVLRTSRLALLPRRFGTPPTSVFAELCAIGLPFQTTMSALGATPARAVAPLVDLGQQADWSTAIRRGLRDDGWWIETAEAVRQIAVEWLDPATQAAGLRTVLDTIGLPTSDGATQVVQEEPTRASRRISIGGTLRDAPDLKEFDSTLLTHTALVRERSRELQRDIGPVHGYGLWRAAHLDDPATLEDQRRSSIERAGPTISVLLPTYDSDPALLSEAIDSVRNQTWPHWQLCIADDASPNPETRALIDLASASDDRIVAHHLPENRGIAGATNAALEQAHGTFVAFLDHDDVLRPSALYWVARLLEEDPELDLIYSDEDRLDPEGNVFWPFFKPDWNPDLLLSVNYITHFTVVRRSVAEDVGRLRTGFDGSQDHDFLLRVTERTSRIGHLAKPLYSWRQIPGSTSADSAAKPESHQAGARAISDALERRGIDATVHPGFGPNWHWVRYRTPAQPLVSVIVPTRNHVELLAPCIEETLASAGDLDLEVLLVDNQSDDPATLDWLDSFEAAGRGKVVRYPHRFSYARQMNLAVASSTGSVLLLLNNDTRPLSACWMNELLGHALRPEVGAVGARLLWPDGRPQHEGIVLNAGEAIAWNMAATDQTPYTRNIRDVTAVTGACLMTRRSVFDSVAGLDEQLRIAYNDVDFCLRVGELGYRVVYTPWAELVHAESSSRGSLHPVDDEVFYEQRWGRPWSVRDPLYNVSLDLGDPLPLRI